MKSEERRARENRGLVEAVFDRLATREGVPRAEWLGECALLMREQRGSRPHPDPPEARAEKALEHAVRRGILREDAGALVYVPEGA